jgi:hypothetical protein
VGIVIREADIRADMPAIRETFNVNRSVPAPPERFPWLYYENPDGPARAWFAIDDRTGAVAGLAAVLPRRVVIKGGDRVVAWNGADFSVNRQYRTVGVAVKLRLAAREAIDQGESPFLYAHPNERMLPIQLRAGCSAVGRMPRHVKLLRASIGVAIADRVSSGLLALTGTDWLVRVRSEITLAGAEPLGDEFTELFESVAPRLGTALVRDAAYLDWRFRRSPTQRHQFLVARRGGRLQGYLVFTEDGDLAAVKDWLAATPDVVDELFVSVIRRMRRRGARALRFTALETHPDLPRLRRLGFVPRPDYATAIAYVAGAGPLRDAVLAGESWYMSYGDRHG